MEQFLFLFTLHAADGNHRCVRHDVTDCATRTPTASVFDEAAAAAAALSVRSVLSARWRRPSIQRRRVFKNIINIGVTHHKADAVNQRYVTARCVDNMAHHYNITAHARCS